MAANYITPMYMEQENPSIVNYALMNGNKNPYKLSKYNAKYYEGHKEELLAKRSARYFTKKAEHIRERITSLIAESQSMLMPTSRVTVTLPDCSGHVIMQDMENALKAQYAADTRITFLTIKRGPWGITIKV